MTKKTQNPEFDFMKMFDPANVSKMFDPSAMMEQFGMQKTDFDPQEMIAKAQAQFDAMTKASEATAQSYKDLMEKQMAIFRDVSEEAAKQVQAGAPQDGQAAYQQAVKRALEIMTELSENAHKANNDAYEAAKEQVDQAIAALKSK